jgi:hypothetical protein
VILLQHLLVEFSILLNRVCQILEVFDLGIANDLQDWDVHQMTVALDQTTFPKNWVLFLTGILDTKIINLDWYLGWHDIGQPGQMAPCLKNASLLYDILIYESPLTILLDLV